MQQQKSSPVNRKIRTKFFGSNFDQSLSYILDLKLEELKEILGTTRNCRKRSNIIEAVKLPEVIFG